jgi:hypothetical protein
VADTAIQTAKVYLIFHFEKLTGKQKASRKFFSASLTPLCNHPVQIKNKKFRQGVKRA